MRILAGLMENGTNESTRVNAAEALLDRGWGRPKQTIASDPDGPLIVEIIQRVRDPRTGVGAQDVMAGPPQQIVPERFREPKP